MLVQAYFITVCFPMMTLTVLAVIRGSYYVCGLMERVEFLFIVIVPMSLLSVICNGLSQLKFGPEVGHRMKLFYI